MAPNIIADSDGDDSSVDSPPLVPPSNTEHAHSPSQGLDDQSASTDPSFFNTVFNEQQAAAREESDNRGVVDLTGENRVTDSLSFDQGFERLANAETHDNDGLWDVPSSPEAIKPRRSARKKTEINARTKITRGLRRQLDDIGYISQEDEPTAERDLKRRHVQTETKGNSNSDDVAPIMHTGGEVSLHIALEPLTSSKREQYPTVNQPPWSSPTQHLGQGSNDIRSSGTATNINTPRSNLTSSLKPTTPERPKSSGSAKSIEIHGTRSSPPSTRKAHNREEEHQPEEAEEIKTSPLKKPPSEPNGMKKTRGRPKKMIDTISTKEENDAGVEATKNKMKEKKKKRGRPKTPKNMAVEEGIKVDDAIPGMTHMEAEKEEADAQKSADINHGNPVIAQFPKLTEVNVHNPMKELLESGAKDGIQSKTVDVAAEKELSKSSNSGRQVYRVGLSKRMKIAPLLKVVRK